MILKAQVYHLAEMLTRITSFLAIFVIVVQSTLHVSTEFYSSYVGNFVISILRGFYSKQQHKEAVDVTSVSSKSIM